MRTTHSFLSVCQNLPCISRVSGLKWDFGGKPQAVSPGPKGVRTNAKLRTGLGAAIASACRLQAAGRRSILARWSLDAAARGLLGDRVSAQLLGRKESLGTPTSCKMLHMRVSAYARAGTCSPPLRRPGSLLVPGGG